MVHDLYSLFIFLIGSGVIMAGAAIIYGIGVVRNSKKETMLNEKLLKVEVQKVVDKNNIQK